MALDKRAYAKARIAEIIKTRTLEYRKVFENKDRDISTKAKVAAIKAGLVPFRENVDYCGYSADKIDNVYDFSGMPHFLDSNYLPGYTETTERMKTFGARITDEVVFGQEQTIPYLLELMQTFDFTVDEEFKLEITNV